MNASNSSAKEAAEREKALRASFVVVPPGDEAKSISCPVCKETLKSEFMEEDEEWVWLNAVRVKDKVCFEFPKKRMTLLTVFFESGLPRYLSFRNGCVQHTGREAAQ